MAVHEARNAIVARAIRARRSGAKVTIRSRGAALGRDEQFFAAFERTVLREHLDTLRSPAAGGPTAAENHRPGGERQRLQREDWWGATQNSERTWCGNGGSREVGPISTARRDLSRDKPVRRPSLCRGETQRSIDQEVPGSSEAEDTATKLAAGAS